MTLSSLCARHFDRGVRERGEELFRRHAVRMQTATAEQVIARVTGGSVYLVTINQVGSNLEVWCDCPNFLEHGRCKHLWAAILSAEAISALSDVRDVKFLEVDWESEFLNDDEPDGETDLFGQPLGPRYAPAPPRMPAWQEYLGDIERELALRAARTAKTARHTEILYCIDVGSSRASGRISLELYSRYLKKNGEWSAYKEFRATPDQAAQLPNDVDRNTISALFGAQDYYSFGYQSGATRKTLPAALAMNLLPAIASTGRLTCRESVRMEFHPVTWDGDQPWTTALELRQDERDQWKITGVLRRGEQRMAVSEPTLLLEGGLMMVGRTLYRIEADAAYSWMSQLRTSGPIPFPDRDRDAVLQKLLELPGTPAIDADPALGFEERRGAAKLGLRIKPDRGRYTTPRYLAELLVDYGMGWMNGGAVARGFWRPEDRVYLVRDAAAEEAARARLGEVGIKPVPASPGLWNVTAKHLPKAARKLIAEGWHVEAEGKTFRPPGATRVSVTSGIDWFELEGQVEYGESTASLPELLAALRRGDSMVVLGDGTFGLLPEEWLERFAPLVGLGENEDGALRFQHNQASLLDALLAAQPDVQVDETFARVRERMRTFQGVQAAVQPGGFRGQLRQYQLEGVGWMEFLRDFGFGGCLADDMGVGKTVQVLATLEARRAEGKGPSLVVAPKSVMFNWREEAGRFTPQLRVLEYHGTARDAGQIDQHDLVLTTYGTLLRDAAKLCDRRFDYVVLDEAQAIKNATTASAKAVRLLHADHRLVLSGTPVENHLGELWSLFEFLNPGMLGEARVLQMSGGLGRNPSEEARRLLAQALRPFILRRTKRQVAKELPEKTEQTVFCELEGPQRKHYEQLRDHYRVTLLDRVRQNGLGRSKMHVLEALLRLRQAACHPGLLDARRVDDPSAKLDVLMEQLTEVLSEGHKALVFSQFTSLLAIVRRRLDHNGTNYEYLDGATNNRQAHVEKFQNDPDCGLFLISLKAGGLGLNLTAAEYVFLLDPWWNPAVEAQAVDRAHRIGQTKPVFAYRLIARDTVEEKVLLLQKSKRELADAILNEDNSLIRDLKREDLELLLS